MKTETILRYIDTQVDKMLTDGKSFDAVISELNKKVEKFSITLKNCDSPATYKNINALVEVCKKRIDDILYAKSLQFNYYEYAVYPTVKLFKLIKFKDKLSPDRFQIDGDDCNDVIENNIDSTVGYVKNFSYTKPIEAISEVSD